MKHLDLEWHNVDGLAVHGQAWLPDAPPSAVLCLVHGLGEHSGRYQHVGRFFADAGVAVFAMDTRGHGKSEGKRGHAKGIGYILNDVESLLEEAQRRFPRQPCFLYGHSMGGCQALFFTLARRRPLTGVIATGPALRPAFEPPAWKLTLGRLLDEIWPSLTLNNEVDSNEISSDPAVVKAYADDPLVHDRISVRLFNEWRRAVDELFERAGELPGPILLMHGTLDKLTSPAATRELAQKIGPKATLKEWQGFKHELHNEPGKQEVLSYALEWMKSKSSPT